MRASGVLLHVTSLPGPYGIGSAGREAKRFVEFLARAGQRFWQILPTTHAGLGNSPYSSYSVFAGNPLLIDPDELVAQGLLTGEECLAHDWGSDRNRVDFARVIPGRLALLRRALERFTDETELGRYAAREADWLPDYALFMALRERFGGTPWQEWPEDIRLREPSALERWRQELADETRFWTFVQYQFERQWDALHAYAGENGVAIVGDIPIYAAMDSADVWASRELFQLDANGRPLAVAGVPPDAFSATGQLWGNPLYRWDRMKQDGYGWWVRRIRRTAVQCDWMRIDHFRGFDAYYAVPFGAATAAQGRWEPGPGTELFRAAEAALGPQRIIAEDLGVLTDSVRGLLRDTGYPGMKILEFAFDSDWRNPYLPFQFTSDRCVVYTGTHDNDTAQGWYGSLAGGTLRRARRYLRIPRRGRGRAEAHWKLIACAWNTQAQLAVAQMQDLLGLGGEARMNRPGVAEGNWVWRMLPDAAGAALAERLLRLTENSGRR